MNTKDIKYFEEKLNAERIELEEELGEIAKKDTHNRGGWEPTAGNMEVDNADENEVADKFEEIEENTIIANQLENQLIEVKAALDRIKTGKFGLCEKCGKPIEAGRLEANPSARLSIKHEHN
ncbi:MAG: TraR/DksA C4-type zinc finger protein [Candidatus Taylorbacteria bacterium]